MRKTSLDAYYEIKKSGLLSERRFQVYEIIVKRGPITQSELTSMFPGRDNSMRPRFAELEVLGVIRSIGTRTCRITGRNVHEWAATSGLPEKSKMEELKAIARLALKHKRSYEKFVAKYIKLKKEIGISS